MFCLMERFGLKGRMVSKNHLTLQAKMGESITHLNIIPNDKRCVNKVLLKPREGMETFLRTIRD